MKRHKKLFILDLDGTIADTSKDIAISVNYALSCLSRRTLNKETIVSYVGDGLRVLMMRCLGTCDLKILKMAEKKFKKHYSKHLLDNTKLYPGVLEVLDYYALKQLAVASNKPVEHVNSILKKLGIYGYFFVIMGGDSTVRRKPYPDQISCILQKSGIRRTEALLIGDSANDVLAAEAAGVDSCYLLSGFNKGNDIKGIKPNFVMKSMRELKLYFN